MENTYRIHSNLLLQINTNKREVSNIHKYTHTTPDNKTIVQFLNKDLLSNVVWYDKKSINKVWYSENDIELSDPKITESIDEKLVDISVFLQQGFDFSNYYGILFVLKDIRTNFVYCSYMITPDMFEFTDNREVINGTYWNYKFNTKIPDTLFNESSIAFGVELVKHSQIDEDTKVISNYPATFEPLVNEVPFVDKFVISSVWDDNLNLHIEPKSTVENLRVEDVLKQIFSESEIDNMSIQYVVRFPADENNNYGEYIIQNNLSPLGKVVIGLPLPINGIKHKIDITAYIRVNGKIATRNSNIIWDFNIESSSNLRNLISKLTGSEVEMENLHIVNVEEKVTIENNIVDVVNNYKTITVPVPTFIELIQNKEIVVDNKLVSIPEIKHSDCYMKVYFKPEESSSENIILIAQHTNEHIVFFDIAEVNSKFIQSGQVSVPFKIYSFENQQLLMSGNFVKQTTESN